MIKKESISENLENQYPKENYKQLEENYLKIINNSIQCLLIFQNDHIVLGNHILSQVTGYSLDEIYNAQKERISELFYFEDKNEDLWETIQDITSNNNPPKKAEVCSIYKDGTKHWLCCYFAHLHYKGQPAAQISFIDITKRKKAEKKAEKKEQELLAVQKLSKISNFNVNLKTNKVKWTPEFYKIIERDPKTFENTVSAFHKLVHPDDLKCFKEKVGNKQLNNFKFEHRLLMPDGRTKDVISHGSLKYSEEGHPSSFIGYVQDITEIKDYERKLTAALNEKELLLREVHHRVKNNLQIITSLINLGSRYEKGNPDEILKDTKSKIRSMALIHEKLYQSPTLTHVNIKEYIKSFIIDIFRLYNVKNDQITLKTGLEDIELNIETSIPLGLIINEIITNIIKYAFPQNQKGTIEIHLYSQIDQIILKISDNGIGIPEKINIKKPETLGLVIIKSLTNQIDGTIQINTNPGTTYTITFKEQKYKKRT
jgi:PAS domain S-box-containing protein